MNRPSTAREALIAEAIGELAVLIDRAQALTPELESSRLALLHASTELAGQMSAFEARMTAITENAKVQAVRHIARRTDDLARSTLDAQTRAMGQAARTAFDAELGPALQRLAHSLQGAADQIHRGTQSWERWLTHAATAAAASALTWILLAWLGPR